MNPYPRYALRGIHRGSEVKALRVTDAGEYRVLGPTSISRLPILRGLVEEIDKHQVLPLSQVQTNFRIGESTKSWQKKSKEAATARLTMHSISVPSKTIWMHNIRTYQR